MNNSRTHFWEVYIFYEETGETPAPKLGILLIFPFLSEYKLSGCLEFRESFLRPTWRVSHCVCLKISIRISLLPLFPETPARIFRTTTRSVCSSWWGPRKICFQRSRSYGSRIRDPQTANVPIKQIEFDIGKQCVPFLWVFPTTVGLSQTRASCFFPSSG